MNSENCLGNRAEATSYWINKQFEALWDISTKCVEKHGHGIKPSKVDIIYGSSLAQLCVGKHRNKPSAEDLIFYGSFGAPKFKFICNHDVLVEFQLKAGHFREEGKYSIEVFEEFICSFRVPFHQHVITDTTFSPLGQIDSSKAKVFIFNFEAATYLRELSGFPHGHKLSYDEVDRKQRAIVKYLTSEYLPLLRKAGYHYIHSLPDFDNLSRTHHIDFSLISNVKIDTLSIFGISVESINTFLKGRWLEAAGFIDELEEDHDYSLYGRFALAEHRAACDDFHFHAYFGPPQIRLLCNKEILYLIDIQDLHIYLDGGFATEAKHIFSKWKIAFIVDVQFIEEEEGHVRRLRLDFSKSRFSETFSTLSFGNIVIEELFFTKIRTAFISYISRQYLSILEEYHYYYIYHTDIRIIEEEEEEEEEEVFELTIDHFRERVTITDTFGFDIVTAITQGSINYDLHSLWRASQLSKFCLSHWKYDNFFEAQFGAPQIQLPADSSSDTVILYLTIRQGALSLLDRFKKFTGGERHEFSAWRLAFEVKLRVREYTKRHPLSEAYFRNYGFRNELVYNQLILDFSTARFRQDLSRLPGLLDDSYYLLMRSKRQALIYSITRYYLPQLKREGYHVLYTIPTWKTTRTSDILFAPSSFSFQFYSAYSDLQGIISRGFGRQRSSGQRNMIILCGMLDNRQRPSFPLPRFSWRWGSSQDIFSGSFALSRHAFLDGWLLPKLQPVNLRTTLIPIFHGFGDAGEWNFELVTLEAYKWSKGRSSNWREVGVRAHGIEFEHRNKDSWTYEHLGDAYDIHNGGYSISCETLNTLIIPTSSKHGACEIRLNGTITLRLEFRGGLRAWSTTSIARWSSVIVISSLFHGQGLDFFSTSSYSISDGSGFSGDFGMVNPVIRDAATLLREQLKDVVIVEQSLVKNLKSSFSGLWPLFYSGAHGYSLRNPIFNERGDILFDLESPLDASGQIIVSGRSDIIFSAEQYQATFASSEVQQSSTSLVERGAKQSSISLEEERRQSSQESFSRQESFTRQESFNRQESSTSRIGQTLDTSANGNGSYFGEDSLLTSSTGIDTPLKTPILDRSLLGARTRIGTEIQEDTSGEEIFAADQTTPFKEQPFDNLRNTVTIEK